MDPPGHGRDSGIAARFPETIDPNSKALTRIRVDIRGAVQGVGFRPFVYRLALEERASGYVRNRPDGVEVEVEGTASMLLRFLDRLESEKPPLSRIDGLDVTAIQPLGHDPSFAIRESSPDGDRTAIVLPDIAACSECLREIQTPGDRRYRYPFTNCTHCGPRFSILHQLPYDRPNTSMGDFPLCRACSEEYRDPGDRRFHAQPLACPVCGPQLAYWDERGRELASREDALARAEAAIKQGKTLAVKGLGGFHLMVNAHDDDAVRRLRKNKAREEKPFALMYPDLEAIRRDCAPTNLEIRLLESPEAPIVLLDRAESDGSLAQSVARDAPRLGVMLPYTPLHHLLLGDLGFAVVATSGNLSEESICIDEADALERLRGLADGYLVHNRPIVRPVDDSIVQQTGGREMVLRRARGYAPLPIRIQDRGTSVLAVGGHLKNTVALSKGGNTYLSQHIGDLETTQTRDVFEKAIAALQDMYEISPAVVVCDAHPDYPSTRFAHAHGAPVVEVQHHHAHVLACMAEHHLEGPVLGVAWDGTGYGTDGTVWGGEFLHTSGPDYTRVARLRPFFLPGGDAAVREPRRSALGLLRAWRGHPDCVPLPAGLREAFSRQELDMLEQMLRRGVNTPLTSSIGRLFDAVAALLGLRFASTYEGQAAMRLEREARAGSDRGTAYAFTLRDWSGGWELDGESLLVQIAADMEQGRPLSEIAWQFHHALALSIAAVAAKVEERRVVLTGGCFQNRLLTEMSIALLNDQGHEVYWHWRVPPNDGGLALGQAVFGMLHGEPTAGG